MIQSTPRCAARPQDAHVIFPSVRNFITESVLICRKFWRASCLTRHFLGMSVFIIWLKFFLSHLRIRPTGDLPLKVKHNFFLYKHYGMLVTVCSVSISLSLCLSDCSYTCHYRCRPFIQLDCSSDDSLLTDQEDFSVDSIETDTNVVRNKDTITRGTYRTQPSWDCVITFFYLTV